MKAVLSRKVERSSRGRYRRAVVGSLVGTFSLCIGLAASPLAAELRVLLAFDGDGVQVRRALRLADDGLPSTDRTRRKGFASARGLIAPVYGEAEMIWSDRNGHVLSVQQIPDPRIAHLVGRSSDDNPQGNSGGVHQAVLERGAWLVSGPDEATMLLVRFPAVMSLALSEAEWLFDLDAAGLPPPR